MMKSMAVRISVPHTEYICMIRGCWSMWVRRSLLDCSAVVRSIGFITWDMRRRFRPRSSSSMTRVSSCRTFRSYSSLLHHSARSSETMRVAFGREPFPADAVQKVAPSHRVRRAAHYMAAMGLWRLFSTQGIQGPLPSASCNACMSCSDCFPDLPQ